MLGFIFGFNARLGRLPFFFLGLALAVVMTAICFAVAWHIFQETPRGATPSSDAFVTPALFIAPLFLFATFTLQCMRIRDIGWDPVYVLSGWLLLIALDKIAAMKIPALAMGAGHHSTGLGALVNLVFVGVLTFWPSGEAISSPPYDDGAAGRRTPATLSAARVATVSASRAGFGLRGQ